MKESRNVGNRKRGDQSGHFSIKYKMLLVFGTLTSIVVIALMGTTMYFSRRAVLEKVENHLRDQACYTADKVEESLQSDFATLELLARSPSVHRQDLTPQEKAQILDREAKTLGVVAIYIVNREGYYTDPSGEIRHVTHQEFLSESMAGRRFISEPYYYNGKEFLLTLTVPIYGAKGAVEGVLLCDCRGTLLNKYIKDIVVGETGSAYIVGKTGVTIADVEEQVVTSLENSQVKAQSDPNYIPVANFERRALSEQQVTVGYFDWKGVEHIGAFAPVPGRG